MNPTSETASTAIDTTSGDALVAPAAAAMRTGRAPWLIAVTMVVLLPLTLWQAAHWAEKAALQAEEKAKQPKKYRGGRRGRYRLRKQVVEPVFGQIKEARGFRQFLMKGIEKMRGGWALIGTVHNILKLAKAT